MKFAVISDIHSNIDALEAVLEDIHSEGINQIYCTGDQIGYLPFPNQVVDRIYEKEIVSIQGNHDIMIEKAMMPSTEEIGKMSMAQLLGSGSRLFTLLTINEENRAYLAKLPEELVFEAGGKKVHLVHGSPDRVDEYIYEENEHKIKEILSELKEDILIYGHTHMPYHKEIGGKHIVNAGSVGKPKHGNPNSTYVIIEIDDGMVEVVIKEVTYDRTNIIAAIKNEHLISNDLIDALENGK